MTTQNPNQRTLYCARSGVPLVTVSVASTTSGCWPIVNGNLLSSGLLHPIYGQSLNSLNKRLAQQIAQAEAINYFIYDKLATEMGLTMSAIMYAMNCMWKPAFTEHTHSRAFNASSSSLQLEPSLPSAGILAGTAIRLLDVSEWYANLATKKDYFPLWRVSRRAGNLNWHGYAGWLDAAMDIVDDFNEGKLRRENEELKRERADALRTVNSAHVMRRIDYRKVWGWIDIQLAQGGIAIGRRTTWKAMFMSGDSRPEDWLVDDIEDLQEAICEHCDIGNTITGFITQRLRTIKSMIVEFYSGFTIIDKNQVTTPQESLATGHTLAPFEVQASQLTELPPAPERSHFMTVGQFLKAQAQHNILKKLWERKQAEAKTAPAQQTHSVADL